MKFTASKLSCFNEDFLSLNQTNALQAVACIGVLLHHITQQVTSYGVVYIGPITYLATIGFLFTAIFFFCSGYGLITSLYSKENYLNHFIGNRLSTIFIPFFTANTVFIISKLFIYGRVGDSMQIFRYITGLSLINSNGWFIIEIFVLYLAFYILFRFIKKKDIALGLLCIFSIGLILYSKSLGHDTSLTDVNSHWFMGEWWYNSTITFTFGLIIARSKDWLLPKIKKNYWPILFISLILLVSTYKWANHNLTVYGYYTESFQIGAMSYSTLTLIPQSILCISFLIVILLINLKLSFSNRVLLFISNISLELFLIQKLFIETVFGQIHMPIIVRYIVVITCSGIAAFALSFINKFLLKEIKYVISLLPDDKLLNRIKARKKLLTALFLVCIVGLIGYKLVGLYILQAEYKDELASLADCKPGDQILFGHFDTSVDIGKERLSWIVVDITDGRYTLVCKEAIASGSFNNTQKAINWENSYLRQRLNSSEFLSIFSKQEYKKLVPNDQNDYLSILTVDQAEIFFKTNMDRQVSVTDIAEADGANVNSRSKMNEWDFKESKTSWWWLRGNNNQAATTAPFVNVDGEIIEKQAFVSKSAGGIRPVITVLLNSE